MYIRTDCMANHPPGSSLLLYCCSSLSLSISSAILQGHIQSEECITMAIGVLTIFKLDRYVNCSYMESIGYNIIIHNIFLFCLSPILSFVSLTIDIQDYTQILIFDIARHIHTHTCSSCNSQSPFLSTFQVPLLLVKAHLHLVVFSLPSKSIC